MKILCLGHATYDITIPLEQFPCENTKNRILEKIECGGGPASTAAYLLGKWGCKVYFAGIVGDDFCGNKIKKELENSNVNVKYLELNKQYETTTSFIITNKQNGSRTTFTYKPKDVSMNSFMLDFSPDIILIDGQEYERSIEILNKYPKDISIIDAGRDTKEIVSLSKIVKWLICSKTFAEKITNIKFEHNQKSINDLYTKMKKIFKNEIIITLEEDGCLYNYEIIPSIKLKSVDTTGAGDIFHGAFIYYLTKGYKIEDILKLANIAGAISVSRVGTRNSVPSKEEVESLYDKLK